MFQIGRGGRGGRGLGWIAIAAMLQSACFCPADSDLLNQLVAKDASAWTRRRAAACLEERGVKFGVKDWLPVFQAMTDDDAEVRGAIVNFMYDRPIPRPDEISRASWAQMLRLLDSRDVRVQTLAIHFVKLREYRPAVPTLTAISTNLAVDAQVRREAERALTVIRAADAR